MNGEISDGNSGSWAVDAETLEVYGYLVAVDAFGAGHVVPFQDALQNIRYWLRVQAVELATPYDIVSATKPRDSLKFSWSEQESYEWRIIREWDTNPETHWSGRQVALL